MAERYSDLYASFVEWDDDTHTVINVGGQTAITGIVQAEVIKKRGQMVRGRFTFLKDSSGDWADFVQAGRIVSLYQYNRVMANDFSFPYREMGAILVQKLREGIDAAGRRTVEVSGLGLEHLLTKYRHWSPIGEETTYSTTLASTAVGPITTALFDGAPNGNKSATLDSVAGMEVGDQIFIEMGTPSGDDGSHVSIITGIEEEGWNDNQLTFLDRIPYNAPVDNEVVVRKAVLHLADMSGFAVGQRVVVTLDSAATHESVIIKVDEADGEIHIRDGLPSQAASGKAVVAYDYSEPATDDVTQIMAPAVADGWDVEFDNVAYEGTADGTTHVPGGDSIWDLLQATAAQTGEFFRIAFLAGGYQPRKLLKWQRTPVASGVTLYTTGDSADAAAWTEDVDSGIIYSLHRERENDIVTRVYPSASDGRINLSYCTADALSAAATAGFTVHLSDELYRPDYVQHNAGAASHGVLERVERYGNITLSKEGPVSEIQNGANALLHQAMMTLRESQRRVYWRCRCHTHRPLFPGQTVTIDNDAAEPLGDVTSEPATYGTLYVLEVREIWQNGVIMSELLLSEEPQLQPSVMVSLARHLVATSQSARRQDTKDTRTTTIKVETDGGTGGVTDHGALLGLADDDHTQYWNDTRGNAKIATHAAIANAHHEPASGYDSSIGQIGQALFVNKAANSGLATDFGLKVDLKANSGLQLDSEGVGLGTPVSASATSTNAVTGGTHSHAVTVTSEGAVNASTILQSDANKRLSITKLGVGVQTSALGNTALQTYSTAATDVGLRVQANSVQSANLMEVTSYGGSVYLRVTPAGDLESGAPAFVSGRTGWQISKTGTAEFNDVYVRGELHAVVFTADEVNAAGGSLMVATASTVAPQVGGSDNVLPAINSSFTLNATASWVTGYNYFPVGSVIRIKTIKVGSGIDVYDIYAEVTAVGSQAGRVTSPSAGQQASAGYYPLTCTRRYGGATGYQIPDGSAMVLWTEAQTSPSGYTGNIHITASGNDAPYIDVSTIAHIAKSSWASTPTTTPRVRVGNLDGVLGLPEQWGIALGTDLSSSSTAARYIVASDLQLTLHNVDLDIYYGASQTVDINSNGNVKFGTNVSSGSTTTFEFLSSTGTLRVGPSSGPSLYWDGTNVTVRNSSNTAVIQLDSSGNSSFEGVMKLGSGGGIYQGDGTFASPGTGLKIWRDGTMGRLATYSGGVAQVSFDTAGKLTAGAGAVYLDANGLTVESDSSTSSEPTQLKFKVPGGGVFGKIVGYQTGLDRTVLVNNTSSGRTSFMDLYTSSSNHLARLSSGSVIFTISGELSKTTLSNSNLFIPDGGVSAGYEFAANSGQFVSDVSTSDWNAIVLMSSTDVAHGMTDVVNTNSYGTLGKVIGADGGLNVAGYSDDNIGTNLRGYVVNEVTTTTTSSRAAVMIEASLKSGTTVTTLGSTGNLLAVRNNGTTRFIIKGNGNFHYDGTGAAYDDYDDINLLRAADLSLAGRLDAQWEQWLGYNRQAIEAAGVVTFNDDGGHMVNGSRFDRLMAGTLWQIHERLARLEETLA
jgi:hypothetical protein